MKTTLGTFLIFLILTVFPAAAIASGDSKVVNCGNSALKFSYTIPSENSNEVDGQFIDGLKVNENGVTQTDDGQLLLKVGGYSNQSLMKYVNGMNYTLSKNQKINDDKFQSAYARPSNDGLFFKSGIEANSGSGLFFLATGGIDFSKDRSSLDNEFLASNMIVGGGIGYFLKNYNMQFGYDNKVGMQATFGIIW